MGDRNETIEANMGLAYAQLIRFNLRDDPDAESIALEALGNAVDNFDETQNCKLSTLASVYIYNALCGYLRSINKVNQIETVSLHTQIVVNGTVHELHEVIDSGISVEDDLIMQETISALLKCFDIAYSRLKSEKQKCIITAWRVNDFDDSHTNIAIECGVSQSYVTQTLAMFKTSIKKLMEEKYENV